ncbi:MAG: ATP-binding cassette domain-containing protein [Gammaproteobacteria bacterium]|nr:ATP-binding cassette domain-containing protein [Gammaproteobacteria bacterium]
MRARLQPEQLAVAGSRGFSSLSILWGFVQPYRLQCFGAVLALLFTAAVTLVVGQGVRLVIDDGFVAGSTEQLAQGVMLLVVLAALMAIGTFFRFYLMSWIGERVSADIRRKVFNHVVSLHPSFFETNRSGEIMSRLTTDTTLLQSIIGSAFSMALRSVITTAGALIMLALTNIKLTAIIVAGVPLVLLPVLLFGRRVRALSRASQDSIADVGAYAGEIIEQIKTVQSYTREDYEKAAFGSEVDNAFEVARRRVLQRAILVVGVIMMVFAALSAMLWVGGSDVINGTMSAGELGAFVFYALLAAGGVGTLSEVFGELQRAVGATDRLVELMQAENSITGPDVGSGVDAGALEAAMLLDGVTFRYPSRPDHAALRDFTLEIPAGQVIALVGPSGAGKSTVFELLQRFYDPAAGAVRLGGEDIRRIDPQELRRQIAVVAQHPALFSADVMHNIRYGNPEASDAEVFAAAADAYADEFIERLPDGYASFLGERGVRLSGGQKQRVAIARAILKNPRILLLDEATSALDTESELKVQKALERLMQDRTTVIIAHRLSTVLHADRIAVIDDGALVGLGTHAELLRDSPLYARLARLQFRNESETLAADRAELLQSNAG